MAPPRTEAWTARLHRTSARGRGDLPAMDAETKSLQCLDTSVIAGGWDHFVRSFLDGYFERHPTFAAGAGRHEFDGRLPDWSPEGLAAAAAWLKAERARAEEFDPATLDERRAFERGELKVGEVTAIVWLV